MTDFAGKFRVLDPEGRTLEEGECAVAIGGGAVALSPRASPPLRLAFHDIVRWEAKEYALRMVLATGETVEASQLGKRFEELVAVLKEERRAHLHEALLLDEPGGGAPEHGAFSLRRPGATIEPAGACEVRVQRTSLAVLPDVELPFLVPYGEVASIAFDPELYAVKLMLPDATLELTRFGKRTDALRAALEQKLAELGRRQVECLGALVPGAAPLALRRLAGVLRDGVPATKDEVEAASPGAWASLWQRAMLTRDGGARLRLATGGARMREAFDREDAAAELMRRAKVALVAVKEVPSEEKAPEGGAKPAEGGEQPSIAEEHGRQVLYFFGLDHAGSGALALEVPSRTASATYVFRAEGDPAARARELCRSLAAVHFEREPIYLPEKELETGPRARYLEAARTLPVLKAVRAAFLGRAIHASLEAWKKQLDEAVARA